MRRIWAGDESQGNRAGGAVEARSDARRSSASLRRLTGESGDGDLSFRWGWSRSETDRLSRVQGVARGWLLRRRVCHIPTREIESVLKDLHLKDKGLRSLVGYLFFFFLFFGILLLESDVTFQHSVETGMRNFINQVGSGPDDIRLSEVATKEDFSAWALSLFLNMYDGTELEDVCNTCVFVRDEGGTQNFPSIADSVWGTDVPLASGSDGNDSFVFDVDNCPLCYGADRASIMEASSNGDDFCTFVCEGLEFCFEERCAAYDVAQATMGEVKGTNDSLVLVSSNADCAQADLFSENFPRTYGATVGLTTIVSPNNSKPDDEIILYPVGKGYVANKNKVMGGLLTEWTYYDEDECEDTYRNLFYKRCFKDIGSRVNRSAEVASSLMNSFSSDFDMFEGSEEQGMVYSITSDVGVYNSGLNFNYCGLLSIFGGTDVITDAVRTVTLRFNTYNGQREGLFASVDIKARFSLGGEVQVAPVVEVFSIPRLFDPAPSLVARAVCLFLFVIMLTYYIVKDVRHLYRELSGGRQPLKNFRRFPVTTATLVHILGDGFFLGGMVLWITTLMFSSEYEITTSLQFVQASEQVREVSEELALIASERWMRDGFAVAGSMVGLARLFLMLRFHPRLSLVTDVLAASAVHLVHFFIMFFMVVGVYANLCWVIFGASNELFATWDDSFVTMTRIALGEFDSIYPSMIEDEATSALIIIVTYQTLQFVLLLNIVISILLDAFQMVQDRNTEGSTDTLRQTVMTTLGRWRIRMVDTVCYAVRPRSSRTPRISVLRHLPSAVRAKLAVWGGGDNLRSKNTGLTRGQRIAASHRHYDIHTAAEVLRRSPLPEKAVWRKMRQIVFKRLGESRTERFNSIDKLGQGRRSSVSSTSSWIRR